MDKLSLLFLLFGLLSLGACVPARPLRLLVLDAETRVPVTTAMLDLHPFPSRPSAPNPNHPQATANAQGEISIRGLAEPTIWQVRAPGYSEQQLTSSNGGPPARYTAHATSTYAGVIYLYQAPEPQVTINLPADYTGPLVIDLQPAPGFGFVATDALNVAFAAVDPQASYVQESLGQRTFTYTATAAGRVQLVVTPLLYDIQNRHVEIREAHGEPLPYRDLADAPASGRAVWGLISDDTKRLERQIQLFVGTREDYQKFLSANP